MSKLRRSAKNRQCTVRQPGVCNYDPATTVLAHRNGAGIGRKHSDLFGCFACSSCHSWLDWEWANQGYSKNERDLAHLEAIIETQGVWLAEGIIVLPELNLAAISPCSEESAGSFG